MRVVLLLMFLASFTLAQSDKPTGAKALFFEADTSSQTPTSTSEQNKQKPSRAALTRPQPHVTGLKYYIELREPDGTLREVNPNRVFHSGERIRLHVSTNVDGDLVIYQKQEDQPEQRLYPSSNVSGSTGHVMPNADVTLPSSHGWFVFDDHPGKIDLTLMVRARHSHADNDATSGGDDLRADAAHELVGATKGSKALRIEDDSQNDKAEYKVVDSGLDSKIPAGMIATELVLSHER